MSQSTSDVVGLIEIELNAEEFLGSLESDAEISLPPLITHRLHAPPTTSTVIIADSQQLIADLRSELARILQQLRETR